MTGMFGDFGKIAGLLTKPNKIREEMGKLQARLAQQTAEGQAGGGMVTVKVNGSGAVLACRLSEEAMNLKDREMLEDLIAAATNDAVHRVESASQAKMSALMGGMSLPPGMKLPF